MKKSKYAEKMVDLVEDYLLSQGVSPDFTIEDLLDEDIFSIRLEHDYSGASITIDLRNYYEIKQSEDVKVKDQFNDNMKAQIVTFVENHRALSNQYEDDYPDDDYDEEWDDYEDEYDEDDDFEEEYEEDDFEDELSDEDITSAEYGAELQAESDVYDEMAFEPAEENASIPDYEVRLVNQDLIKNDLLTKSEDAIEFNVPLMCSEIEGSDMVAVLYSNKDGFYCTNLDVDREMRSANTIDTMLSQLENTPFSVSTLDSIVPRPILIMSGIQQNSCIFIENTNQREYGAVHILNHKAMEKVRDFLGTEHFFIVPSSVHEVMCIKEMDDRPDINLQTLYEKMKEVGEAFSANQSEVLSNCIYRYNFEERKLTTEFPLEEDREL